MTLTDSIDCQTCEGTGWYVYTTRGTPHSTVCEDCCRHALGRWLLEKHYGDKNGMWCCKAGCGHCITQEEYEEECENLLRSSVFK